MTRRKPATGAETSDRTRIAQSRRKRADPADDLLTALITAEHDGAVLDDDELGAQVILLHVAGHETTVNLIANGMNALLDNPDRPALWLRRRRAVVGLSLLGAAMGQVVAAYQTGLPARRGQGRGRYRPGRGAGPGGMAESRALCAYCQVATVASAVSLALALPEAKRALRTLRPVSRTRPAAAQLDGAGRRTRGSVTGPLPGTPRA